MLKYFLTSITLIITTLLQQTFFSNSDFYSAAQLPLVILVFIVALGSPQLSFIASASIGLIMDWFSFFPAGTYLIIFILVWVFAQYLLQKYLSNFSLLSVVLMTVMIVIFKTTLVIIISSIVNFFNFRQISIHLGVFNIYQILYSAIVAVVLFFVINRFSKLMNYAFIRN